MKSYKEGVKSSLISAEAKRKEEDDKLLPLLKAISELQPKQLTNEEKIASVYGKDEASAMRAVGEGIKTKMDLINALEVGLDKGYIHDNSTVLDWVTSKASDIWSADDSERNLYLNQLNALKADYKTKLMKEKFGADASEGQMKLLDQQIDGLTPSQLKEALSKDVSAFNRRSWEALTKHGIRNPYGVFADEAEEREYHNAIGKAIRNAPVVEKMKMTSSNTGKLRIVEETNKMLEQIKNSDLTPDEKAEVAKKFLTGSDKEEDTEKFLGGYIEDAAKMAPNTAKVGGGLLTLGGILTATGVGAGAGAIISTVGYILTTASLASIFADAVNKKKMPAPEAMSTVVSMAALGMLGKGTAALTGWGGRLYKRSRASKAKQDEVVDRIFYRTRGEAESSDRVTAGKIKDEFNVARVNRGRMEKAGDETLPEVQREALQKMNRFLEHKRAIGEPVNAEEFHKELLDITSWLSKQEQFTGQNIGDVTPALLRRFGMPKAAKSSGETLAIKKLEKIPKHGISPDKLVESADNYVKANKDALSKISKENRETTVIRNMLGEDRLRDLAQKAGVDEAEISLTDPVSWFKSLRKIFKSGNKIPYMKEIENATNKALDKHFGEVK